MSLVTPFRLALAMAAIGLCVGSIQAQQQRGRFQGGGRGGPPPNPSQEKLRLLTNEAVQKDLELADDQKADLKKVAENARTQMESMYAGFRDLSESEREKRTAENRTKGEALGKEILTKIEAVLLPHQLSRLTEISIQVQGTRALVDNAEVAKELGISEQQKEKLAAVREEMGGKMREAFGGGEQGRTERFAALFKESGEKTLAVLTADQKAKFAKMKGEPFDVDAAGLRFGGGGGFGGGAGGQGGRPGQPGQGGQGGGQPRTRPGGNNNTNN